MAKSSKPTSSAKAPAAPPKALPIKLVADNRKARFDYEILTTYEAGLQLVGSEVKALRADGAQLKDAYVVLKGGELVLVNAHIAPYRASSYNNHLPERVRKLLLNSSEIAKISRGLDEKGYSCVPLKIYFKGPWAKVEIALVRGKKAHDKRDSIKRRESDRELRRVRSK